MTASEGPGRASLPALLPLLLLPLCAGCDRGSGDSRAADHATGTVNFATFVGEIGNDTLRQFSAETGIATNLDTYDSNLALEARLLAGNTGFDVVVPGNNFLPSQIAAGVYHRLDRERLPNWRHLDPALLAKLAINDPGNAYAVPYLVGATALAYDATKVEAALGAPAPDSWALLFDPAYASRLAGCGISIVDSPWMMSSIALLYLGRDPNSERPEDLRAAMQALQRIRPYLRDIGNQPITNQLATGELCVAVTPAADVRLARDLARETGQATDLQLMVPKEGAILWMDVLAIPADAPHPEEAHALIDFLMRPEVIAAITRETYVANANRDATALVPASIRDDPSVYPTAETLSRMHLNAALSADTLRWLNREFAKVRTGE